MNPFTQATVAAPFIHSSQTAAPTVRLSDHRGRNCAAPSNTQTPSPASRFRHAGLASAVSARTRRPAWLLGLLGMAAALAVAGQAMAIDVNQATLEELQTLRGIGPKTAQTILDERGRGGPFDSIEDFSDRVKGIGSKKAASLQAAGLTIGAGTAELKVERGKPGQALGRR